MIAQNSSHMRGQIQQYGCYMMSLVWWGWYRGHLEVDPVFINEDLYYKFVRSQWMRETCFIKNPVAILQFMQVPVKAVRKADADYVPADNEICIGQFKTDGEISHFVVVDSEGHVMYDPWQSKEGGSRAVRNGQLISWRVFTLK